MTNCRQYFANLLPCAVNHPNTKGCMDEKKSNDEPESKTQSITCCQTHGFCLCWNKYRMWSCARARKSEQSYSPLHGRFIRYHQGLRSGKTLSVAFLKALSHISKKMIIVDSAMSINHEKKITLTVPKS